MLSLALSLAPPAYAGEDSEAPPRQAPTVVDRPQAFVLAIRMYVCTYVRTYVRTYGCMYVCIKPTGVDRPQARGAIPFMLAVAASESRAAWPARARETLNREGPAADAAEARAKLLVPGLVTVPGQCTVTGTGRGAGARPASAKNGFKCCVALTGRLQLSGSLDSDCGFESQLDSERDLKLQPLPRPPGRGSSRETQSLSLRLSP